MPKAIATSETVHKDLKSLEGAWVEVKRLSWGEKVQRRAMTAAMKIDSGKGKDFAGEMQLITEQSSFFDFQKCIVDHNLFKDEEETDKFDFHKPADIRLLDPRVGEEIDQILSDLNNFEAEDDEGN